MSSRELPCFQVCPQTESQRFGSSAGCWHTPVVVDCTLFCVVHVDWVFPVFCEVLVNFIHAPIFTFISIKLDLVPTHKHSLLP